MALRILGVVGIAIGMMTGYLVALAYLNKIVRRAIGSDSLACEASIVRHLILNIALFCAAVLGSPNVVVRTWGGLMIWTVILSTLSFLAVWGLGVSKDIRRDLRRRLVHQLSFGRA